MKQKFLQLGILVLTVVACVETDPVSPVPEITYKNFELHYYYDTILEQYLLAGELLFDFVDGNADLGVYAEDMDDVSWNEDNYNIFLTAYEKIDSLYYQVEPDTANPPPWYTIFHDTKLDRVGQNKIVKGNIKLIIIDIPQYDTMRYDFFIRDRAGNNSNTETTDDVSTIHESPIF